MTNAKKELQEQVGTLIIKCAEIREFRIDESEYGYDESKYPKVTLRVGYSNEELDNFYKQIDVGYDSGYGGQELFGTVWFEDGTWLERGEYDGSEWWEHKVCPEIPKSLLAPHSN